MNCMTNARFWPVAPDRLKGMRPKLNLRERGAVGGQPGVAPEAL